MSKRNKIQKIHSKLLKHTEQIEIISKIVEESDKTVETMVLGGLINDLSKKILKLNEKLGIIFKI